MKKFRNFIILLLVTVMLLGGCGQERDAVSGDNTVSFTDALGREVTVEKNPQRVCAMLGSFADVWVLSGGSLVGAPEDAREDFSLALPGTVVIGGAHSPDIELIMACDPDFIIASASTASNVEALSSFTSAGITVAYFDVDNFYDYLNMLDICTDITGHKELYEKNGLALQRQIEEIKREYASKNIPSEQKKILLLRTSSGSVKAKGSEGTVLGELLSDMGLINIADSDTSLLENLSIEAIIRQEPYRIFAVTMGNDTEKAEKSLRDMINENPAWASLEAIEEGRLYMMDKKLFNLKPNGSWALAYEKLYEILKD